MSTAPSQQENFNSMPPRPPLRALATPTASSSGTSSFLHPKPHLSQTFHLPPAVNFAQPAFENPTPPRLPIRRRPDFAPGGFGLGAPPRPIGVPGDASVRGKGKERVRALEEALGQISREEQRQELAPENSKAQEEAEACYVVSGLGARKRLMISHHLQHCILTVTSLSLCYIRPTPSTAFPSPTRHGAR